MRAALVRHDGVSARGYFEERFIEGRYRTEPFSDVWPDWGVGSGMRVATRRQSLRWARLLPIRKSRNDPVIQTRQDFVARENLVVFLESLVTHRAADEHEQFYRSARGRRAIACHLDQPQDLVLLR